MQPNDLPPGVYRDPGSQDDNAPASTDLPPVKPDWKDFVALTIATYQLLLVPLLAIIAGVVGVLWLLRLL